MIHKIFSINDIKAEAYITPFFLPTSAMALRAFSTCLDSADHQFAANPSDFTLFQIGEYNDSTGMITGHTPKSLGNGVELQNQLPLPIGQTDEIKEPYVAPVLPGAQSNNSA